MSNAPTETPLETLQAYFGAVYCSSIGWLLFPALSYVFYWALLSAPFGSGGPLHWIAMFLALIYIVYWYFSWNWPRQAAGGPKMRSHSQRNWPVFKWLARYCHLRLHISEGMQEFARRKVEQQPKSDGEVSVQLPTNINYLLGYHPHGPFSWGNFLTLGTDAGDFAKRVPGIATFTATLNCFFNNPLARDYAMGFGAVSVSRESLTYLLDPKVGGMTGNLVSVVVGGANEVLDSHPGRYIILLSRRNGFFRLALSTGAHLIPCIGFGEPRLLDQVPNPPGSLLRRIQDKITHLTTFMPALFYSRRILPYRFPLNVVLGEPMPCPKIENPTYEEIDELRERYKKALTKMFNENRPKYDPTAADIEFV